MSYQVAIPSDPQLRISACEFKYMISILDTWGMPWHFHKRIAAKQGNANQINVLYHINIYFRLNVIFLNLRQIHYND